MKEPLCYFLTYFLLLRSFNVCRGVRLSLYKYKEAFSKGEARPAGVSSFRFQIAEVYY